MTLYYIYYILLNFAPIFLEEFLFITLPYLLLCLSRASKVDLFVSNCCTILYV